MFQKLITYLRASHQSTFSSSLVGRVLFNQIKNEFPELEFLLGQANESSESYVGKIHQHGHSVRLTGHFNREFDRAWTGLLCFRSAYLGCDKSYEEWIHSQDQNKKLSRESFKEIHAYTRSLVRSPEDFAAMTWSVLFNDLGKYDQVHNLFKKIVKNSKENHDEMLSVLINKAPHHFPGFLNLSEVRRQDIIAGFGSSCEIAQFVQLERPLSSLIGLQQLKKTARDLYILHSVFDVAGALGDKFPHGSFVMNEETWTGFKLAIRALSAFDSGKSCHDVYQQYMSDRGELLGIKLDSPQSIALIKLACFGRFYSKNESNLLHGAWDLLSDENKSILERELAESGLGHITPILVGYAPAMIANALGFVLRECESSPDPLVLFSRKKEALKLAFTLISRVFQISRDDINKNSIQSSLYVGDAAGLAKTLNFSSNDMSHLPLKLERAGYGSDISFITPHQFKASML